MEAPKPKILVISPLYPPHIGGLESHAEQFNLELVKKGYKILVLTPKITKTPSETTIIRFPAWEVIHNYPIPKLWNPTFWRQLKQAKNFHPDLIITRTRFFTTSFLGLILSKIWRIPLIHIEHGSDYVQLNNPWLSQLAKLYDHTLGKLVLTQADKLIANSQASANFVKKLSGRQNLEIIYRGVNHETINQTKPNLEFKQKHPNKIIITYLGRLIDGKGVPDLLRALKNIPANFHCLIIGNGSQKSELKKLSEKLEINDQISFVGEKSFTQAIALLKASDILVHPSYTEGLPTSVIEAALCRAAIIATNVGGTSEIISETLIPPRQPQVIANALQKLINNPHLRHQLAQSAYNSVSQKFSWKTSISRYEEIIRSISPPARGGVRREAVGGGGRKKITFFISELDIGGAEKQLLLILPELNKQFEIHVICAIGHGVISKKLKAKDIPVHYLNITSRLDPRVTWRLYKKLKLIKPHTLVTMLIYADILGRISGRLAGTKKIITSHRSSLVNRDYLRLAYFFTDWLVDKQIVQSQAAKKRYPNATVIHNTVALPNPKQIHNQSVKNIICVANLKPGKGHEYLLEAFASISPPARGGVRREAVGGGGSLRLLLVGTGPLENQLKQLSKKLNISNQVKFLGTRQDIPDLLRQSDIFVLPTEGEGMSNATLEAMAIGLPVITSNIPANQAIITHQKTGLLFQNKSAQDLKNKLDQLINNPNLRQTLSQNAKQIVEQKYSLQAIVPRWINILSP